MSSPNLFPTSNDPTELEVVQEAANLVALQAAITSAKNALLVAIAALNNVSQSTILSDATPFAGASIAAIKAKTDLIPADITAQLDTTLQAWQYQPDAVLAQATPVQNQYYTILNTTANVFIKRIRVRVDSTGETLQVKITIDGQTLNLGADLVATAGTGYYIYKDSAASNSITSGSAAKLANSDYPLECRSIKIEIRKTTAAGSGTLNGFVEYAKR